VRANPSSLAAQFKLYRNLNALFDVLSTMTEAAGTFGPKNEYETLAGELNNFEQARIALANRLQNSTAQQDAEIARLRTAVLQAQAAAQAAQAQIPPKKIVVDDNAPAKKKTTPTKKKSSAGTTAAKPANPPQ
jgi:peptidoglycan hydrolase CwlO-like protein